jgi:geranylgeranyl pyrophosphate synthase/uncharacterized protein with NAD-binding domain and iron-sulfur cluster
VYQLGWRLGGKGASGRDAVSSQRILEHGLHLFLGFYDNAFRMMRECYRELHRAPDHPMREWTDAFKRSAHIGLAEHHRGLWRHFSANLPEDNRLPGDEGTQRAFDARTFLKRASQLALELLDGVYLRRPGATDEPSAAAGPLGLTFAFQVLAGKARNLVEGTATLALLNALQSVAALLERAKLDNGALERDVAGIRDFLERHAQSLLEGDPETRRVWELVSLLLAAVRGVVASGLHRRNSWRDWERIDDYDLREWLKLHGAPEAALGNAVLKGIYDIAFAYEDGAANRPRYAAGQALRAASRFFFDYKGAPFWEMQAGMGDVVFAPLYLALQRRGVKFRFFHELTSIGLSADKTAIDRLIFAKQVPGCVEDYQPLITVKGLECWPSEPKWASLEGEPVDPAELEGSGKRRDFGQVVLEHQDGDFDHVVLALGIASIPSAAPELLCDSRWQAMVRHIKTVRTQSAQLWLNVGREQLGWSPSKTHVSAYIEPFDTWSDMSQLIRAEAWPESAAPRSIAYFVNVMPSGAEVLDAVSPETEALDSKREANVVRENLTKFLKHDVGVLWPLAARSYPDDFRWELLFDARDGTTEEVSGPARLDGQYWRANIHGSERYTACLPGSTKYRIAPDDTGFERLTIAGDWTWNALNVGCVEAAVTSGQLAANAISGRPRVTEILGLDAQFESAELRGRRLTLARDRQVDSKFEPAISEARSIVESLSHESVAELRAEQAQDGQAGFGSSAMSWLDATFRTPPPAETSSGGAASPPAESGFGLVEKVLLDYGESVRSALLEAIPSREPRRYLYDLLGDYPKRRGRMFRPGLCIASAAAFGAKLEEALPSAVALELLHNAFLIHDDIEDESMLRRGAPTLNALHGNALALNAGDGLVMLAMNALRSNFRLLGPDLAGLVFEETQRMVRMTVEGQAMDIGLRQEGKADFSARDYFDVILKKTCWYTTLVPIRIGALLGRRREVDEQRFFRFAFYLGAVFQIMDDVMNLNSVVESYGKEISGDLYEGKPTLMLVYLLEVASPRVRQRVHSYLAATRSQRTPEETEWIRLQLVEHGCIDRARAVAKGLAVDAVEEFEFSFFDTAEGRDREFIRSLPAYMLEREARLRA